MSQPHEQSPLNVWGVPPVNPESHPSAAAPQGPSGPEVPHRDLSGLHPVVGSTEFGTPRASQEGPARTPNPDEDHRDVAFGQPGLPATPFGKPRTPEAPVNNASDGETNRKASEAPEKEPREKYLGIKSKVVLTAALGTSALAFVYGLHEEGSRGTHSAAFDRETGEQNAAGMRHDTAEFDRMQTKAQKDAEAAASAAENAGLAFEASAGLLALGIAVSGLAAVRRGNQWKKEAIQNWGTGRAERHRKKAAELEAKANKNK